MSTRLGGTGTGVETPAVVVPLRALDTDVDLVVGGADAPDLAEVIRSRWHLALRDDDRTGGPGPVTVAVGRGAAPEAAVPGRESVFDEEVPRLLMRLTHAVTGKIIAAQTGRLLMLHAGGLSDLATGATAVFVAKGNTGKSTLCTRLGPGRGYLSDETIGIRRDGTVAAYGKPISTRRPDWPTVKDEMAPAGLGLRAPAAVPFVAGLVLLDRLAEHPGEPEVERLGTLEAIAAITPESSGFTRTERPLSWLATVLEATGGAVRVRYAQAAELGPLLEELLTRPGAAPVVCEGSQEPVDHQPDERDGPLEPADEPRVRAVPVQDQVERDGESVVLLDGQVLHLSALATAVRAACIDWVPLSELAHRLAEQFGAPEQGIADATRALVDELVEVGVVTTHGHDDALQKEA